MEEEDFEIIFNKSLPYRKDISLYETGEKIGEGQFGEVRRCTDVATHTADYAIKFIEQAQSGEFGDYCYTLLTREVSIQSQVKHPALLPLISFGEDAFKRAFIVSPYMSQKSLFNHIFTGQSKMAPLNPTQKFIVIYGTASGMKCLHRRRVIHRDLKPANILLNEKFYPFVCDFGFAKYVPVNQNSNFSIRPGTPMYQAPELLAGNDDDDEDEDDNANLTPRVDVYAFGIILFNILTGRHFCNLKTDYQVNQYVLANKRPKIPETVPQFYQTLITECWVQNPFSRPTFEQIVERLNTPEALLPDVNIDEIEEYKQYVNAPIFKSSSSGSVPVIISSLPIFRTSSLTFSHTMDHMFSTYLFKLQDRQFTMKLSQNATFQDIKSIISIEIFIPPSYLRLKYGGNALPDDTPIRKAVPLNSTTPIIIEKIRSVDDLPLDEDERSITVENEVREFFEMRTLKQINRRMTADQTQLEAIRNYFICGRQLSLMPEVKIKF